MGRADNRIQTRGNPLKIPEYVEVVSSMGLNLPKYDYASMALSVGDTIETWIFKTGGSTGTTVATVVIVYTDSTREIISTVTKT